MNMHRQKMTSHLKKKTRVSCNPGWLQIHYVTKDDHELLIFLPFASQVLKLRCKPPYTVYVVLRQVLYQLSDILNSLSPLTIA